MLKLALQLLIVSLVFLSCKQRETRQAIEKTATFYVDNSEHSFGHNMTSGKEYSCDFVYYNIGKTPLVINNVKTSCHCTKADYPKEPLMPGESGKIRVTVKETSNGYFHRYISIYSNSKCVTNTLMVSGTVGE